MNNSVVSVRNLAARLRGGALALAALSIGFLVALAACVVLLLLSGLITSKDRVRDVSLYAIGTNAIHAPGQQAQDFGDCAILEILYVRDRDIFLNVIDTRWQGVKTEMCNDFAALVEGHPDPSLSSHSYNNYPLGGRATTGILVGLMSVRHAMAVHWLASYLAPLLLLAAAAYRRVLVPFLPIGLILLLAFGQQILADNLLYSIPFSFGFAALALFMVLPLTNWYHRLAFMAALGTMTGYFDNLVGGIPAVLAVALVCNQFAFGPTTLWAAFKQVLAIAATFLGSFVALSAIHFAVLSFFIHGQWDAARDELRGRMSGEFGPAGAISHLSLYDVGQRLWENRLMINGSESGAILLVVGLDLWILVGCIALFWRKVTPELLVLALAAGGILIWFPLFKNHSYIHAWLMVRLLMLPAAFGFSALIVSLRTTGVYGLFAGQRFMETEGPEVTTRGLRPETDVLYSAEAAVPFTLAGVLRTVALVTLATVAVFGLLWLAGGLVLVPSL